MEPNSVADALAAVTSATVDSISNKKIKTAANSTSKFGAGAATYGQKENQPPETSSHGNNIFKHPKHNSLLPQQKQFQRQKQQSQSSLNMSIKSSQIVVPVYPDEFSAHPQYLSVMSMKVSELRKELRTKNLETGGLKKELQKRLLTALLHPEADDLAIESSEVKSTSQPILDEPDDDSSPSAGETHEAVEAEHKENRMSLVSTRSISDADQMSVDVIDQRPPPSTVAALIAAKEEAVKAVHSEKESAAPVHHSFVKSSAALFSPNRITSKFQQPRPQEITLPAKSSAALSPFASIKKSLVKTASSFLLAHKPDAVSLFSSATKKGPKNEPDVPIVNADSAAIAAEVASITALPVSKALEFTELEKEVEVDTVNPSAAVKIPSDGTKDASLKAIFSSSIVKDKQKMLADARKQRLAELRGKSKPLTSVVASSATSQVLKSIDSKENEPLKQVAISTSKLLATNPKEEDKRTLMTAKIREKHAALKVSTQPYNSAPVANSVPTKPSVVLKPVPVKSTVAPVWPPPPPEKPQVPENPLPLPLNELNIRSPLDTYQISDRDESDSDESDDSGTGPKKKIPDWAQKENLITALKQQYDENGNRLDPDALFPEVETCDLEAIFDKKRNRFKKRTSSGNWTKDRVTAAEKLVYKRTMGFDSTS